MKETKDRTPNIVAVRANVLPILRNYERSNQELGEKPNLPGKILSFDPGVTNLSWVFLDEEYGTHLSSKVELPGDLATTAAKMRYLEFVIEHLVRYFLPQLVVKEGLAHEATHGLGDSGKMQYAIERVAMDWDIPLMTIANSSMRSYFKATGQGSKSLVRLRVSQRYNGLEFETEDETDAFALGKTAIAILKGEYVVNKSQRTKTREAKAKK